MSAAPRFSTADIAKGAQQPAEAREAEAEAVEREQALQREQTMQREQAEREIAAQNDRTVQREQNAIQREQDFMAREQNAASAVSASAGSASAGSASADAIETVAPLFAQDAAEGFRRRWDTVQASFVDDPRRAVTEADSLVAETMQRLADTFAQERARLEQRFESDRDVSTEDLRVTLRHYRSFFSRLLSV